MYASEWRRQPMSERMGRDVPVFLSAALYDAGVASGLDMRAYAVYDPIPELGTEGIWIVRPHAE